MAVLIRKAEPRDGPQWLDLLQAVLSQDYPSKRVYDPAWIAAQLDVASGHETWVAEAGNQLLASITVLPPFAQTANPVMNLARQLNRPESYADGSAKALIDQINGLARERGQWLVARVLTSDNAQQILLENLGYACVGFQPFKHMFRVREGVLFYVRSGRQEAISRLPLSESLPQINELSSFALGRLNIPAPQVVRNGATGYPLQTGLEFHQSSFDDFELWRMQAQMANPEVEISCGYNLGAGLLRVSSENTPMSFLGQHEDRIVAGLAYLFDEVDRCVHVVEAFATDDLAMGAMLQHALKVAQEKLSAVYVEVDVLLTAPRLLKSAEQLGFVPVAYLPAFYRQDSVCADVVKLVKLNLLYSVENTNLTTQARSVVDIIDHNFQDLKVGLAIINLLKALPIFGGLGEGELRKIARLFTQKLFRPGEIIFKQGDRSDEAYVVMRGQLDVFLSEDGPAVASIVSGQILGEQAFLDGGGRGAMVRANQASILLVVQRTAFNDLVQREPHLGMVVLRNIAVELSSKLRKADRLLLEAKPKTV
jgi:CRP/FNR family cyclic AMP-dependent transcriptional regulator